MVTSTMPHLSKPVVLLAYIAVLLSACAPVGYIKPGMTEEEVARDLSECAEIAKQQAYQDIAAGDFGFEALHPPLDRRDRLLHGDHGHSYSELKRRYRRFCMRARGYQYAPLDDPVME